jgi:ATP-binding cassette, subfamily B, bacterial
MLLSVRSDQTAQGKRTFFGHRRRLPVLMQMDATECGAACLAMLLTYYGRETNVTEVRQRCGSGRDGQTARTLVTVARSYGLRTRAISLQEGDFRYVTLPAIIHWSFNHFVVVERWSSRSVKLVDPALGRRRVSLAEFDANFTGVVLLFEPDVHFSRVSVPTQLSIAMYFKHLLHTPGFLLQILGASLLLQLLGLGLPLLTKISLDTIIPGEMSSVLPILGLGIAIIVVTQALTSLLRSSLLIYLQAKMDIQMMPGFFEHLLRLPYQFFQQRSSGDLLARMNSNTAIRDLLTSQMLSSLLDGGTVLIYLALLFTQTPVLALLALALGAVQAGSLLVTTRLIHELNRRDLIAQGKAQGYMAEALVGIATLKASGAEERALYRWSNLFFEHLNVSTRRDYLAAVLSSFQGALSILAPLLLLLFGTMQVLHGSMSLGTMVALNSLAAAFLAPFSSLVGSGQRFQLARAHFERIADVLTAEPEQNEREISQRPRLRGQIELNNINFRYAPNTPLVLRDISLRVEPGQKVALVGHTGSGKSTLGKLLLGLYLPTGGNILYDGVCLQQFSYRALRSQLGVVMQEAALFSGSIRENIALTNPEMNLEQIAHVASLAALHDDIMRMPMGYETYIAEGGSALSGGQRQRLALARALAQEPSILLLDEATSHLDVVTEQRVEQNLHALTCTRIIIAHRLSTVRDADLILVMHQGEIVERGTHEELLLKQGYYAQLVQQQIEQHQS